MGSLFFVFDGMRKMLEFDGFPKSAVGPERSRHGEQGGVGQIIGAPTSPLGLSPKIEEEEKRRT